MGSPASLGRFVSRLRPRAGLISMPCALRAFDGDVHEPRPATLLRRPIGNAAPSAVRECLPGCSSATPRGLALASRLTRGGVSRRPTEPVTVVTAADGFRFRPVVRSVTVTYSPTRLTFLPSRSRPRPLPRPTGPGPVRSGPVPVPGSRDRVTGTVPRTLPRNRNVRTYVPSRSVPGSVRTYRPLPLPRYRLPLRFGPGPTLRYRSLPGNPYGNRRDRLRLPG